MPRYIDADALRKWLRSIPLKDLSDGNSACRGRHDYPMRYCGECGAKMDGKDGDNG